MCSVPFEVWNAAISEPGDHHDGAPGRSAPHQPPLLSRMLRKFSSHPSDGSSESLIVNSVPMGCDRSTKLSLLPRCCINSFSSGENDSSAKAAPVELGATVEVKVCA